MELISGKRAVKKFINHIDCFTRKIFHLLYILIAVGFSHINQQIADSIDPFLDRNQHFICFRKFVFDYCDIDGIQRRTKSINERICKCPGTRRGHIPSVLLNKSKTV